MINNTNNDASTSRSLAGRNISSIVEGHPLEIEGYPLYYNLYNRRVFSIVEGHPLLSCQ